MDEAQLELLKLDGLEMDYWNPDEGTNISTYLDSIEVEHVLGAPYHPQSQGAIEVFYKTEQKAFSKAYDKTKKDENEKFDLELSMYQFLHYYN